MPPFTMNWTSGRFDTEPSLCGARPWPSDSFAGGLDAVIHANGLKSSGATIPPTGVVAAYASSQYSRGGASG